jgi:hypothetical protein
VLAVFVGPPWDAGPRREGLLGFVMRAKRRGEGPSETARLQNDSDSPERGAVGRSLRCLLCTAVCT